MEITSAFFFVRSEEDCYQDEVVYMAEALRSLGVRCYSNADYWREEPGRADTLLVHDPSVSFRGCDMMFVASRYTNWVRKSTGFERIHAPLPGGIFDSPRTWMTVYLDCADGYETASYAPEYRQFDLVLRTKYNTRFPQPGNMAPWVLGLSNRMARMGQPRPGESRSGRVLWNFGATHHYEHQSRQLAREKVLPVLEESYEIDRRVDDMADPPPDPYDRFMWEQSVQHHAPGYYHRLRTSAACAAFCGNLVPSRPRDPRRILGFGRGARALRGACALLDRVQGRQPRWVQWDSWRFWESAAAGCAPILFDLEKTGVLLPVMPVNGEHYIGIDPRAPGASLAAFLEEPGVFERVGRAAREWALENYSPPAAARLFADLAGRVRGGTAPRDVYRH